MSNVTESLDVILAGNGQLLKAVNQSGIKTPVAGVKELVVCGFSSATQIVNLGNPGPLLIENVMLFSETDYSTPINITIGSESGESSFYSAANTIVNILDYNINGLGQWNDVAIPQNIVIPAYQALRVETLQNSEIKLIVVLSRVSATFLGRLG